MATQFAATVPCSELGEPLTSLRQDILPPSTWDEMERRCGCVIVSQLLRRTPTLGLDDLPAGRITSGASVTRWTTEPPVNNQFLYENAIKPLLATFAQTA